MPKIDIQKLKQQSEMELKHGIAYPDPTNIDKETHMSTKKYQLYGTNSDYGGSKTTATQTLNAIRDGKLNENGDKHYQDKFNKGKSKNKSKPLIEDWTFPLLFIFSAVIIYLNQ